MIPAGLTDLNIEFLAKDGQLFSIQDGVVSKYPAMPEKHITFLKETLEEDPDAKQTLVQYNPEDQVKLYGICRFGGCNGTPDASEDYECLDQHEYYDCGHRGECPYEGKRCKEMKVQNGVLTPHMLKVVALIGKGQINKEIADQMKISENTVANHLATIITRIGVRTRVDIAVFAKEKGII